MKARLPRSNNKIDIKSMAEKFQEVQADMEKKSAEMDEKVYTFTSGGGAVKVEIKGTLEIINLDISSDIIDIDNKDMLQEVTIAAINGAIKMAKSDRDSTMQGFSDKIKLPNSIPGLF